MKQTHPDLARLRRKGGGTWRVECVVEGFDLPFVSHVNLHLSRRFAIAIAKYHIAKEAQCRMKHVILVSIEVEGG